MPETPTRTERRASRAYTSDDSISARARLARAYTDPAAFGQFHPFGPAVEQRGPDPAFQGADLLAQAGLRDSQHPRGFRHRALLGDGDEVAEMAKSDALVVVHIRSLLWQ